MTNSDIKSRQIAYYRYFVKLFLDTINNYPHINDFQAITDKFATSLKNDCPNPYIFKPYFYTKAELLKYPVSEDINITRANSIIAFCNQLCSLFFRIIDPNEIDCIPIIEELDIRLGQLQSDLSLLIAQYDNNYDNKSPNTRSDLGPELD